ncbi:type IV pilus assembly protein PilX [Methylomarinovum caldicuralii]|uniref:Type IV pilus assembly protein PilX n=1 Tax=Methylomarinovum caldicuralii TaxID=438856 RepID=A0AAU9CSY9_9GAMM|nr:pilus assembly protein [Methylomarinovum caldicuralii]BCX81037.1 type IV pilus assembly protein PilX [Methylomarinovum caldicuralii]
MTNCKSFQTGAALIVGLVMLLVMTVLGVAAMQTNLLEEKMAGNYRDQNLAFQAAEAALRDAEADITPTSGRIISGLTGFAADCTNGLCDATAGFSDVWKDATKGPNGVTLGTYTGAGSLALVACQPRYWIEGYQAWPAGAASWKTQYRITAVGCGGNANTQVVLQEVFAP